MPGESGHDFGAHHSPFPRPIVTGQKTSIPRRFQTLDALRGMGALAIMAFHLYCFGIFKGIFFTKGYLAVDLFFTLSGVVLAEAYTRRLSNGLSLAGFIRIRLVRFYPFYVLALLMSLSLLVSVTVVHFIGIHQFPMHVWNFLGIIIYSLSMLPMPFSEQLYPIVFSAWSLFYETIVNFFWAGMGVRLGKHWIWLVIMVSAVAMVFWGHATGINGGQNWSDFKMGCCRVFYSFNMGLMIHAADKKWIPRINPWIILLLVLAVLGVAPPQSLSPLFDLTAALLVLPFCVLLATVSEPSSQVESQLFSFLGETSYGIYMIHISVVLTAQFLLEKFYRLPCPSMGVLLIVGVVTLAAWMDRVWDRPARRWLNRMSDPKF
jgi:peptidoglycan/LPS O-acetylase OafA/YrhL